MRPCVTLFRILHAFQNSVENTVYQKVRALACRVRQPRTGKNPGLLRKAGKSSSDLPYDPCGADFSNEKSGFMFDEDETMFMRASCSGSISILLRP